MGSIARAVARYLEPPRNNLIGQADIENKRDSTSMSTRKIRRLYSLVCSVSQHYPRCRRRRVIMASYGALTKEPSRLVTTSRDIPNPIAIAAPMRARPEDGSIRPTQQAQLLPTRSESTKITDRARPHPPFHSRPSRNARGAIAPRWRTWSGRTRMPSSARLWRSRMRYSRDFQGFYKPRSSMRTRAHAHSHVSTPTADRPAPARSPLPAEPAKQPSQMGLRRSRCHDGGCDRHGCGRHDCE